ncbi:MAG: ABC transporter permease [Bacteroidales bacterium]|nr:ABC transporter permease [Bacteroidales bacterium]
MIKVYLLIALRHFKKNLLSLVINILGLAIGMTAFILIIQYVRFELSYDDFHEKETRIYRIQQDRYNKGELTTQWAAGCSAVGQALYENFPEVENFTRFTKGDGVLSWGEKKFREENIYMADTSFFEVFSFKLLEGDVNSVLKKPFEAILSQSTAHKYFGDEDPIGKSLLFNGELELIIVGIFEDVKVNSHLKPDILVSWETRVTVTPGVNTAWQWDGFYNYILLNSEADYKVFEAKIPAFVEEQIGEDLRSYNSDAIYNLQPLRKIHLTSNFMFEAEVNGNAQSVYSLIIIAIFLVIIAWINYINLSTAKSLDRAKEVGMRKISGANRRQLISQFLSESILVNIISIVLAILLVSLIYPLFNQITGEMLDYSLGSNFKFWAAIIIIFIMGAILSGAYPAFFLSSFKPVSIIKGKFSQNNKGLALRKFLVIFQFTISIVLIAGTLLVYKQISFMQNKTLGVDIDNVLVIQGPSVGDSTYNETFNAFKEELLRNPGIEKFTSSTAIPGRKPPWNAGGVRLIGQDPAEGNQYRIIGMDWNYIDLYGLTILEGRNFSPEFGMNSETVIFNEKAVKLLGFDDYSAVLDKQIFFWGDTFSVVGVVKDFHQEGLKEIPDPLVFRFFESVSGFYSIKLEPQASIQDVLTFVEEEWGKFFSKNPFSYFFLDDYYREQYKGEIRFGIVFGSFSFLTIFIACLGLFGLSSFITIQRTKEIGIRKVLGSSVFNSILLLIRYFIYQIMIAVPIGLTIAYFVMQRWLENFAFRITIGWWFFVVPVFVVLVIAVTTVIAQVSKTARVNPAESLRYE